MNFRGLMMVAALLGATGFFAFYPPSFTSEEKEAVLMQTILQGLNTLHYSPQTIDDAFSEKAFDLYLKKVDGAHRWLTQKDVSQLEKYKTQLDDQANAGTYEMFNVSVRMLDAAYKKTQGYYQKALAKPFNLQEKGELEFDGDKRGWAKSDKELEKYWFDWAKYETMTRFADNLKKQEEGDEEYKDKSREELEKMAREDALKFFDRWYDRLLKLKRSDRLSDYLNAFTGIFDPHTDYYEPIEKENFDISMSGKLEGIGARLQTEGEYTKVTSIVVGGPAWKQGDLKEDDVIMKVRQGGEKEVLNIAGMSINDVVKNIRGKKDTEVTLTVKKVDGSIEDITITRDIVIMEEGFAKSLITETKANEKVGYIRLPRFYADFNDRNGRRCAKDVAEEVEKLKAEGVEGIVIDLRNNGGGSLRDVVKMSGLFVEKGPMVQVKSRGRKAEVLEDEDASVQWDGHLIIMVNNFSASASEILAAALQDYDRAVIVGSPSTFGKGTVQRFFDLDRAINGHPEVKPLGQIKLTTQKFYRVNGGSTQLKGVTPDIILPDNYFYIETGEKETDHPLPWTEIEPATYSQDVYKVSPIMKRLQENSNMRVKQSKVFQKITKNAKRLKEQRDDTSYPLNLTAYQAQEKALDLEAELYKDMFEAKVNARIENLRVDIPGIEADESKVARNNDWKEGVEKDVYVEEVLNIMHDMIELKGGSIAKNKDKKKK